MNSKLVLTGLVGLGWLSGVVVAGDADLVINEIRIDQPGGDVDEYFELSGSPGASLDELTYVVIGDGAGGSGVIENATDLTGQVIGASGFFVAAEATFTLGVADLTTTLDFENSDNVTHMLVSGFTGASGDDLDIDDDCVLDSTPWTSVLDSIALVEQENAGECNYGPSSIGPDGTFVPAHVYRCVADGTWTIGAFDVADGTDTPGAANLECVVSAKLELRLLSAGPYEEGDRIDVAVWMADLGGVPAAGFQAFFTFDSESMSLSEESIYTDAPFGFPILPIEAAGQDIDLAAGLDFLKGQDATADDSKLAILRFTALTTLNDPPPLVFRDHDPPNRISNAKGMAIEPLDLVEYPIECPADIAGNGNNPDGQVSFPDLLRILSNWGPCPAPCPPDINCDGTVDFADLLITLSTWGPCPG